MKILNSCKPDSVWVVQKGAESSLAHGQVERVDCISMISFQCSDSDSGRYWTELWPPSRTKQFLLGRSCLDELSLDPVQCPSPFGY